MTPLSLLAAQKLIEKLTANNVLEDKISSVGGVLGISVPPITPDQIILSPVSPDLADKNMQLTYPRICVYSNGFKNTQREKFRSFSGQIGLVADIWASADLITQADNWIHIYVECVAEIVQSSAGDWGDGLFFPALYDVQFDSPRSGGLGFVESARLTLGLGVSIA